MPHKAPDSDPTAGPSIYTRDRYWAFALYVAGGTAPHDAYRRAYDAPAIPDGLAGKRAGVLLRRRDIRALIEERRDEMLLTQRITAEQHLAELQRLAEIALERGDTKTAVKAQELRGKVAGLYVERHVITHENMTEEQAMARLRSMLESNPDLARLIAPMAPKALIGVVELPKREKVYED